MLIGNPIYDTAFKFMMQDEAAAEQLIGLILGTKVHLLNFSSTERVKDDYKFGIFRMDFKAEIETEGQKRVVILELQKAKKATDIERFRSYLGSQYSDNQNVAPIIAIYILNYHLAAYPEFFIEIDPVIKGKITQDNYTFKDAFVDNLTHKSLILQISRLEEPYKSEIERVLSFFDQHHKINDYILDIQEIEKENEILIKRLGLIPNDDEQRKNIENELLIDREWEASIVKKEKVISILTAELESKDKELEIKDKELEIKDKELEIERQKAEGIKFEVAKSMKIGGLSFDLISKFTGLSIEQIEKL